VYLINSSCKDSVIWQKGKTKVWFSFAFQPICITFASVYSKGVMGRKFACVWSVLARYKYLITIVIGVAVVGFIDENSYMKRIQYDLQISRMKEEIRKYNIQNEQSTKALDELKRNPKAIRKIARERYFMKADDEDIYVLSTDQQVPGGAQATISETNETAQ
jgi:cell division protein DivIC